LGSVIRFTRRSRRHGERQRRDSADDTPRSAPPRSEASLITWLDVKRRRDADDDEGGGGSAA
jgi:hypothetical protein